jgi:hypothetical protein
VSDEESTFDDQGGLYVDFSSQEADSESRDFEPLPVGKYLVTMTSVELRESKSAKNQGKPMYSLEFTVVDDLAGGSYARDKRKTWTNACLWSGALYTITHVMKATGFPVSEGRMRIPSADELVGQTIVIGIAMGKASKGDDGTEYPARPEVKSFWPEARWAELKQRAGRFGGSATGKSSAASEATSLLS